MPAISISIPQMVDLALATPDLGGINISVLHGLMQIIVNKMEMSSCRVEFRGANSDVFESLVGRMPQKPLVQIQEYELDPEDAMKRYPVGKSSDKGPKNIFTIKHKPSRIEPGGAKRTPPGFPLQPIQVFSEEDFHEIGDRVLSIHDITVPALPTADELIDSTGDENVITEMWKLLNIEKRLEAVEAALRRSAEKLRKSEMKLKHVEAINSEDHNSLLIELIERIGVVEEAIGSGMYVAQTTVPIDVSAAGKTSVVQTGDIGERTESQVSAFKMARQSNIGYSQQIINDATDRVLELLCNDKAATENCAFFDRLKSSILKDFRSDSENQNKHRTSTTSGYDRSKSSRGSGPEKDCREKHSLVDIENISDQSSELKRLILTDSIFLSNLKKALDGQCVCPTNIIKADDIREVYDRLYNVEKLTHELHHSAGEGTLAHYQEAVIASMEGLRDLASEFQGFRADFLKCMIEVQEMLDAKLDKHNVPALKHYVSKHVESLRALVSKYLNRKDCPEAITAAYSYVKDLKCISCNTEVRMKDQLFPANVVQYPKARESTVIQATEAKACFKPNRYCGGSHTVTSAEDRLWRKGNFMDQFFAQPPLPSLNLQIGADGMMYRVDPIKSDCICLEPVVDEINRCLKPKK